jgi:multimeric flavodoxin WrbA
MFNSGELDISPCKGCLGCAKGDGCVVADDMRPIYAELKESDALVLGSPLYMAQMSGQASDNLSCATFCANPGENSRLGCK